MADELNRITDLIASLPGIGRKSATRIAFYLLKQPASYVDDFTAALKAMHDNIAFCDICAAVKSTQASCKFCSSEKRNQELLCIVEQPSDVLSIENTGDFNGLYHVLMGVLSPLDGIRPEDLRFASLRKRIIESSFKEIIVATNPSIEGNATAHFVAEVIKELKEQKAITLAPQVTRIASGLAIGSQLDYADSQVISQSLKSRTLLEI